jgi:hypothetical protein
MPGILSEKRWVCKMQSIHLITRSASRYRSGSTPKNLLRDNPNGPLLAEPLINFMVEVLPWQSGKVYMASSNCSMIKKDYEPIFRDILKIDLSEASSFFTTMYKTQDWVRHTLIRMKYFFLPHAKRSDYLSDIAKNQHKLFQAIMSVAKTWSGSHFRIYGCVWHRGSRRTCCGR